MRGALKREKHYPNIEGGEAQIYLSKEVHRALAHYLQQYLRPIFQLCKVVDASKMAPNKFKMVDTAIHRLIGTPNICSSRHFSFEDFKATNLSNAKSKMSTKGL